MKLDFYTNVYFALLVAMFAITTRSTSVGKYVKMKLSVSVLTTLEFFLAYRGTEILDWKIDRSVELNTSL